MDKVLNGIYYTPKHIADMASGSGGFMKQAVDSMINPPYSTGKVKTAMKIQSDVINILGISVVDGIKLYLPKVKLDRALYLAVNKVLEGIGGKWNRKEQAHLFEVDPSDILDEILNTGEWTDEKKEYQFFETPTLLAKRMVSMSEIKDGDILLEPSAGKRRILNEFPHSNISYAVEVNKDCFQYLVTHNDSGAIIMLCDFLEWIPLQPYPTKIIMNPPFTKGQDVKHILHAWNILADGGILLSIVSESPFFRDNQLSKDFRQWITNNNVSVESLDPGTFKDSGTMVRTRLIVARKA